jgi:hypothetical protein
MAALALNCKAENRRGIDRARGWSGIDYVEVIDERDQHELCVHFFGQIPEELNSRDVVIEGGRRVRNIRVTKVEYHRADDTDADDCLRVRVDKRGDFSTYTLRLVGAESWQPSDRGFGRFDPRYAHADFSFKAGCPSELDCKTDDSCPPEIRDEPEISYLAKDYASFRQLILDRLAFIMPQWQERHVPDIGVALVELLAYVADHLSYLQDAVATEAYLETARQRISLRRHARLVDYHMHEGCNARAWLCIETDTDITLDLGDCYFVTSIGDAPSSGGTVLRHHEVQSTPAHRYDAFESIGKGTVELHAAHTKIFFYTWGDTECCLPRGATSATLRDNWTAAEDAKDRAETGGQPGKRARNLHLKGGDILIFEEVVGPKTGSSADADPTRRHAVRLVKVTASEDPLLQEKIPGSDAEGPIPVLEIEWAAEDALPFPFCLSARQQAPACDLVSNISVAHGNVILVDHGRTIDAPEDAGEVERIGEFGKCECEGSVVEMSYSGALFRPVLKQGPLTFSVPLRKFSSASEVFAPKSLDPRNARPQITLHSIPPGPDAMAPLFEMNDLTSPGRLIGKLRDHSDVAGAALRSKLSQETLRALGDPALDGDVPPTFLAMLVNDLLALLREWNANDDLLGSSREDFHFVVEMDNEGRAHLRFGNGDLGFEPEPGSSFIARYRIGNGPAGNVGADTITTLVQRKASSSGVQVRPRNPMPARGGTVPEAMAEVRLLAPGAFRKELQRAITANDYSRLAERKGGMQHAGTALRWNGSWYEAQVAADPSGSEEISKKILHQIEGGLHRYRRIGHDLAAHAARYVPLHIEMIVCVLPHYLRGHVRAALLECFSDRVLADGSLGFFHPDNLSFGESVFLSRVIARAQAVAGVESVVVTIFQRLNEPPNRELEDGILRLGPLEIAQLNNDPGFPEHGKLVLRMKGGR